MARATWGPPHLGGGVFEGKPANLIPDTCMFEAMNVEFSQLGPRTRQDFTVDDESAPGTPPYAGSARFETTTGTVYQVLTDSLGDIYAKDESGTTWTQINLFATKGHILSYGVANEHPGCYDANTAPANPEKWGYGMGIMCQDGDFFKLVAHGASAWTEVLAGQDKGCDLKEGYKGAIVVGPYHIRRRLTIQATTQVILYPFKNILWISDQVGRPHFWDGTTFGEVVCFLNPRDDTAAITDAAVAGALPAGEYRYRLMFISSSGAFCPTSPEMDLGTEYFTKTVLINEKVVLTDKVYKQGFPSWATRVALYRTKVDPPGQSPFVCSRNAPAYVSCEWSLNLELRHRHWSGGPRVPRSWRNNRANYVCKNAGACPDKRVAPAVHFFYIGTFDLDATAIQDDTLDAVIEQNEFWMEYGSRKHPVDNVPANWTDLPTYINKVEWFKDWSARLFCVSSDAPDEIRYSGRPMSFSDTGGADEPGWWFQQNARVAGRDDAQKIRAGFELAGAFYVAKDSAIFALDTQKSADPMNWALVPVADNAGAASGAGVLTTTKYAYLLGYVHGQARLFAFNGFEAKDVSDALRTTLDSLTIDTGEGRALIDSVAWESYLIFSAAPWPGSPARTQVVVDRRTGAWTAWDAQVKHFSKGVPHPSKLLCVQTGDAAEVYSFLKGWGAITSYVVTKAYEITQGQVWKIFTGFWMDMLSESGLTQADDVPELGLAVWAGGEAWNLVPQNDGTLLPVNERKQLWRPLPLNTSGDFVQLKIEINELARDFSLHRLIFEHDPKLGRRPKP